MRRKGFWLFGRRKRTPDTEENAQKEDVSEAVSDATEAALLTQQGNNAAYSLDQALLSQSQAHGVLFANMVSEQKRQITVGHAAAVKSAARIFGVKPEDLAPDLYPDD